MSTDWTQKDRDILTTLWGEGKTISEIGSIIAKSVSAIKHMRGRMGLPKRAPFSGGPRRIKPREPVVIKGENIYASHKPKLIHLTGSHCHFPIGDPKQEGFHYCGRRAETGEYCKIHHKLMYRGKD